MNFGFNHGACMSFLQSDEHSGRDLPVHMQTALYWAVAAIPTQPIAITDPRTTPSLTLTSDEYCHWSASVPTS